MFVPGKWNSVCGILTWQIVIGSLDAIVLSLVVGESIDAIYITCYIHVPIDSRGNVFLMN